jgi:L-lactate dehydrogenase (cytochrome)
MQVFLYKDRGLTAEFISRAQAAGYQGLVLTVDNQVMAVRDRDARNGLMFPMKLRTRGFSISPATPAGCCACGRRRIPPS